MKLLTKEEEAQHYRATLIGGTVAGFAGLAVGVAGVAGASRRYHFIKNLTLPLKAFLITSSGTFAGIIGADHASRSYESSRNPIDVEYRARESRNLEAKRASETFTERALEFGRKERYKIVGASWIASMATAFALVNRNKYLTGPQKLVQARVYAQFLTLGVLVASAAFEISDSKNQEGHWETVKSSRRGESAPQSDGDDMWKEMVAAEEERLKERDAEDARFRKPRHNANGNGHTKSHATGAENDAKTSGQSGDASNKDDKSPKSGGAGKHEVKGEKSPVKGADEAKDRDGESAKGKK